MSKFLWISGALLILLSLVVVPPAYSDFISYHKGEKVMVRLVRLSECRKGKRSVILEFKKNRYAVATKCRYTRNNFPGQRIKMIHVDETDQFFFPVEEVGFELGSRIVIGLLGLMLVFYSFRKMKQKPKEDLGNDPE